MANKKHLKILQQGKQVWNKWRIEKRWEITPDLRNVDLQSSNLQEIDFSLGVNLQDANLQGANLEGADFSCADIGDCWGANLSRANLSNANLSRAKLYSGVGGRYSLHAHFMHKMEELGQIL